jgi:glycosyltransferase involved in cell wall biosynthesis
MSGSLEQGSTPGGSRSPEPRLSVIITAHQRREFLRSAVDSVLCQTTDAYPVQTIVVKDFVDPSLDAHLRDSGILSLDPEDSALGCWVSYAARYARAPVLVFLDDDDLFAPGKLAAVDGLFREAPNVGYYHNAIRPAHGEAPRDVAPLTGAPAPLWTVNDASKDSRTVEAMWRAGAAFNHSSIAVRRELIEGFRPELERLVDGYSAFLFYAALVSHHGLALDQRPWTLYRIHPGNESPLASGSRQSRWSRTLREAWPRAHDARLILDLVARRRPEIGIRPLERVRARNDLFLSWTETNPTRARRAEALIALVQVGGTQVLPGDLVHLALGGLAVARRSWVPMRPA